MSNILLVRIDNRLIHGQVGVTWVNHLGANLILVANDKVADDTVQQSLMEMVVPDTVATRFFTVQKTIDVIHKASESQHIFIVCKTPKDVLRLVEGGVPIKKVNIGNMHFSKGKTQISTTVSLDEEDKAVFRKLKELGVQLEIRRVPDEAKDADIYKFIE